jgi:two-component sensor histidine kinase
MPITNLSPQREKRLLKQRHGARARAADAGAAEAALSDENDRLFTHNETALREVNHRAKNSLTVAISLLRLQSRRQSLPEVSKALEDAAQRLHHLARIHEMLSRVAGDDAQLVDMTVYLAELSGNFAHLDRPDVRVELAPEVAPIELDCGRAIDVALLAGEAISNALKHAFPTGTGGVVRIQLRSEEGDVILTVEDDGVGFGEQQRPGSMGLPLMAELARGLGGAMGLERLSSKTRMEVRFPQHPAAGAPVGRRSNVRRARETFKTGQTQA